MKRALALLLPFVAGLSGCNSDPGDQVEPQATEVPKAVASAPVGAPAEESKFGTPVKDRVATIGLLNKRNNLTQDLVLKSGESRRVGNVIVRLATCERSLPWENPAEEGAFVQVFVEERAKSNQPLVWRKVFSGWLFKDSPSLNVVEHPVYDVWVKSCAMKFPGEEADPAASSSTAAKAPGRARAPSSDSPPAPAASSAPAAPVAATPAPAPD
jgi:hypothetical protein